MDKITWYGQCRRDDSFPFISSTTSACHQIHQRRPTVNRRGSKWTHAPSTRCSTFPTRRVCFNHTTQSYPRQASLIFSTWPPVSHDPSNIIVLTWCWYQTLFDICEDKNGAKRKFQRGVTRDSEAARHKISPVKIHRYLHSMDWRGDLEEQASQDS